MKFKDAEYEHKFMKYLALDADQMCQHDHERHFKTTRYIKMMFCLIKLNPFSLSLEHQELMW